MRLYFYSSMLAFLALGLLSCGQENTPNIEEPPVPEFLPLDLKPGCFGLGAESNLMEATREMIILNQSMNAFPSLPPQELEKLTQHINETWITGSWYYENSKSVSDQYFPEIGYTRDYKVFAQRRYELESKSYSLHFDNEMTCTGDGCGTAASLHTSAEIQFNQDETSYKSGGSSLRWTKHAVELTGRNGWRRHYGCDPETLISFDTASPDLTPDELSSPEVSRQSATRCFSGGLEVSCEGVNLWPTD